jgi:hypothetical protein
MGLFCCPILHAENIDPYNNDSQYAYGENVGWINFQPNEGPGVHVSSTKIVGYVWAENIGWISLSCENTGTCETVGYGVINDGAGNLSGYAWAENIGWINFNPTGGRVTIDDNGNFNGYAWGENIGWINFTLVDNYVKVCKVSFHDLANFVALWLETGSSAADLDGQGDDVDFEDYSIFAGSWLDYCPDGWQLK